nr:hypothetical protein GCM10010200_031340 [Actinomadura rugatobispora]
MTQCGAQSEASDSTGTRRTRAIQGAIPIAQLRVPSDGSVRWEGGEGGAGPVAEFAQQACRWPAQQRLVSVPA